MWSWPCPLKHTLFNINLAYVLNLTWNVFAHVRIGEDVLNLNPFSGLSVTVRTVIFKESKSRTHTEGIVVR